MQNPFYDRSVFMRKFLLSFLVAMCAITGLAQQRSNSNSTTLTGDKAEAVDRLNDSADILKELTGAPDSGIPDFVLKDAKCVATVPSMIKGGFIFGANHGRGVATCRTAQGWSAPAFFTLTGGSWGAQIGVQAVDLVMLVMNDGGMKDLLDSNFKLGATGSVAGGPVGRHASASTDYKMSAQVLTYSRARGLFAGLTLDGAAIRQDNDSTRAFYGKHVPFRSALTGKVEAPELAKNFLANVGQSFDESRDR